MKAIINHIRKNYFLTSDWDKPGSLFHVIKKALIPEIQVSEEKYPDQKNTASIR